MPASKPRSKSREKPQIEDESRFDPPHSIPEHWEWKRVKDVGEYLNGYAFNSDDWKSEGRPIIRIQNLTGTSDKFNYFKGKVSERFEVKNGDLLIAWSATLGAFIWEGGDAVLNQHIFKVLSRINKRYHYYCLQTLIDEMYRKSHGQGMVHVTKPIFENIPFPLPPTDEQKRIVTRLDSMLGKLKDARRLIEEAKESFKDRRAAILAKAFRGELTAKWREENRNLENVSEKIAKAANSASSDADEVPYALPTGWSWQPLEKLLESGPQNGLYKAQTFYGNGQRILRIDNFYEGEVVSWSELKRLKVEKKEADLYGLAEGDIVVNRVNSLPYLGKCALIENMTEPTVFESNMMRFRLNQTLCVNKFIIYFLCSETGKQLIRQNAKHAVNQASINQEDVKSTLVPIAPANEQKEVVRQITMFLGQEKEANELLEMEEHLDLLEKSILSKAFRGELH